MRAIQVREPGGPEVLEFREVAPPEPAPGQALVEVAAAGVNYIDTYHRSGLYPVPLPFIPGSEGAGTVRAVGEGVSEVAVGDRVAWTGVLGSYAEQAVVPADRLVPLPDGVTAEDAAAALLQGMTAHYLATSTYAIQPGDWALVHAAAGGVGLLLTQIAKLRGGHVLGTVSTPDKAKLARETGADEIASYDDFAQRARDLTGGEGFPVVYDGVGRTTFDASLDALRIRGMMVLFGASSGPVPPFDLQVLNAKGGLFITRPSLAHYTRDRAELLGRAEELFGWIRDGRVKVHLGGRYPLADAARAHEDLQGRRTTGKLLLLP
ncbi:quinone oxidoreductase family protein [Actinopolymorpha alba]|uniref:quinone oxidoreductase family protein n=1 Tax=Actinopolymorpha alba TaxID=533267 RepID=UPI0003A6498D|nr:quinone oxidoreductase [Actinopolymorpha alba]